MNIPVYILLIFFYISIISAVSISPRAFLGCAQVLDSRIHCFGGATGGSTSGSSYDTPTNDHFYMDLSSGTNDWTMVTGATGENLLVPNSYHLSGTIANKGKFIVYGGLGPSPQNTLLDNPLWSYDPKTNTWSVIPLYGQYTVFGAMVDIGSINSLWTWGGKLNNTGWFAQNQLFSLNYGGTNWNIVNGDPVDQNIRLQYTATLGHDNVIYMLGGLEVLGLTNDRAPATVDMLKIRWYDSTKLTWGVDNATVSNQQSISGRTYHTATLVPGASSFVVYGGSLFANNKNQVQADYAYLYDYGQKKYTPLNFANSTGAGPRSGHCAVAYNTDIYIMFGFNENYQLLNDIHAIDVSNPTQPIWRTGPSPQPSNSTNTTTTPSPSPQSDGSPVLSSGGIAGIAIGAAIVLVAIGAGGMFFFYRKRRQQKQFQLDDPRQHQLADEYMLPTAFPDHQTTTTSSSNDQTTKIDANVSPMYFSTDANSRIKPTTDERDTSKPHGDE